jgi:hypothetical protein
VKGSVAISYGIFQLRTLAPRFSGKYCVLKVMLLDAALFVSQKALERRKKRIACWINETGLYLVARAARPCLLQQNMGGPPMPRRF